MSDVKYVVTNVLDLTYKNFFPFIQKGNGKIEGRSLTR